MQIDENASEYILAKGPEGLSDLLESFWSRAQTDKEFAATKHHILYLLGDQKSLITVDTQQQPFQFWYYDLLGRPATRVVRKTIAKFMQEKFGIQEEVDVVEGEQRR